MKLNKIAINTITSLALMLAPASYLLGQEQANDNLPLLPAPEFSEAEAVKSQGGVNTASDSSEKRTWNLQDADVRSVINAIAAETGKSFIVDPRVQGKVTLVTQQAIDAKTLYQVFLSTLDVLGYTAVPGGGNSIKIIPASQAKQNGAALVSNKSRPQGDEVVVQVFPCEFVDAQQLVPILRPLLADWGSISSYSPSNTLILVGQANSLEHITEILHRVDTPANNEIDMMPLKYATATDVVKTLNALLMSQKQSGVTPHVSLVADDRTNGVLISGNKPERIRMRVLISELDVPVQGAENANTQVVYLRYLKAKDLAPVLNKIVDTATKAEAGDVSSQDKKPSSNGVDKSMIVAEPNVNAVIINAPMGLMRTLQTVIERLDIRPAQVMVEAAIVEMNESELRQLGLQFGSVPAGGSSDGSSASVGFQAGVGIIQNGNWKMVISALQANSSTNILSTPSLVVMDNQVAQIRVGKEVATQSGSYATTGSNNTVSPFSTYNYRKVGLHLKVTPQINQGNSVRLNLDVGNDTLQDPANPGSLPVINENQITNSVIVNSGDILVIAGLISNDIESSSNKIPVLGDVPVLGQAFKYRQNQYEKKNLMVFIHPVILHSSNEATTLTEKKYTSMREKLIRQQLNLLPPEVPQTILPPMGKNKQLPLPFSKQSADAL